MKSYRHSSVTVYTHSRVTVFSNTEILKYWNLAGGFPMFKFPQINVVSSQNLYSTVTMYM